jgi:hypothetical protein
MYFFRCLEKEWGNIRICFSFQSAELQHDRAGSESRLQWRRDSQAVSTSHVTLQAATAFT